MRQTFFSWHGDGESPRFCHKEFSLLVFCGQTETPTGSISRIFFGENMENEDISVMYVLGRALSELRIGSLFD